MRTMAEAAAELQAIDPATAVTHHAIRKMVLDGIIPCIHAGKKRLINMDGLLDYLTMPTQPPAAAGTIRPIGERRAQL